MQRQLRNVCVAGLLFAMLSGPASGQVPGGSRRPIPAYERPAISPYLDLLAPGRGFERNYFRRVRPEIDFRQNQSQLRQSVGGLNRRLDEQQRELQSARSGLTPTGHSTNFLSYGGYYQFGR